MYAQVGEEGVVVFVCATGRAGGGVYAQDRGGGGLYAQVQSYV